MTETKYNPVQPRKYPSERRPSVALHETNATGSFINKISSCNVPNVTSRPSISPSMWKNIEELNNIFGLTVQHNEDDSSSPFQCFERMKAAVLEIQESTIINALQSAVDKIYHISRVITVTGQRWTAEACEKVAQACALVFHRLERQIKLDIMRASKRTRRHLGIGLFRESALQSPNQLEATRQRGVQANELLGEMQNLVLDTLQQINSMLRLKASEPRGSLNSHMNINESVQQQHNSSASVEEFLEILKFTFNEGECGEETKHDVESGEHMFPKLVSQSSSEISIAHEKILAPQSEWDEAFVEFKWKKQQSMPNKHLRDCDCPTSCPTCGGKSGCWQEIGKWKPSHETFMHPWLHPHVAGSTALNLLDPEWSLGKNGESQPPGLNAPTKVGYSVLRAIIVPISKCMEVHSQGSCTIADVGLDEITVCIGCNNNRLEKLLVLDSVKQVLTGYITWCRHFLHTWTITRHTSRQDIASSICNALLVGADLVSIKSNRTISELIDAPTQKSMKATLQLVIETAKGSAKRLMNDICTSMESSARGRRNSWSGGNTSKVQPYQSIVTNLIMYHLNPLGKAWKAMAENSFSNLNRKGCDDIKNIFAAIVQSILQSFSDQVLWSDEKSSKKVFTTALIDDLEVSVQHIQEWAYQIVKESTTFNQVDLNIPSPARLAREQASRFVQQIPALKTWRLAIRALRLPVTTFPSESALVKLKSNHADYEKLIELVDCLPDLDLWLELRETRQRRWSIPWN